MLSPAPGHQAAAVEPLAPPRGHDHGLGRAGELLEEHALERQEQGDVETVKPHDRLVPLVAVIVPDHGGREDEVAGGHAHFFPVNTGISATSFHDEPQRRGRVAMGAGRLARQDELHRGVESRRGTDPGGVAGIRET